MSLSIEQKQKFARLTICRKITQRISDLWRMGLEAELSRGVGRTDKKTDDLLDAIQVEQINTEATLAFFEKGDRPDFCMVPDLPLICGFFELLEEYLPLSSDWSRAVYTVKQSHEWRCGANRELVPAVPRPKDRYQEGYAAGRAAEAAAREAAEDLDGWDPQPGSYTVNGQPVEEDTELVQRLAEEDTEK